MIAPCGLFIAGGRAGLNGSPPPVAQPAREASTRLRLSASSKPVQQLDRALCEIAARHGKARRDWSCRRWSTRGRPLQSAQADRADQQTSKCQTGYDLADSIRVERCKKELIE